jgi:hypothetical protein
MTSQQAQTIAIDDAQRAAKAASEAAELINKGQVPEARVLLAASKRYAADAEQALVGYSTDGGASA